MGFKKEPQIKEEDMFVECLTCSTAALKAPMDMIIAVGFGSAYVTKGKELIYDENDVKDGKSYPTVADIEKLAKADPNHDWRIVKYGPMHGETFQRHGDDNWVCIESNEGFS